MAERISGPPSAKSPCIPSLCGEQGEHSVEEALSGTWALSAALDLYLPPSCHRSNAGGPRRFIPSPKRGGSFEIGEPFPTGHRSPFLLRMEAASER